MKKTREQNIILFLHCECNVVIHNAIISESTIAGKRKYLLLL
jgi:hypothetical protein